MEGIQKQLNGLAYFVPKTKWYWMRLRPSFWSLVKINFITRQTLSRSMINQLNERKCINILETYLQKPVQSVEMCLNIPMITSALNRRVLYLAWISNWTVSEHSLRNYHFTYSRQILNQYWPMAARYGVSTKAVPMALINFVFVFFKSVLGVKSSTSTTTVYGQLGFFPPSRVAHTTVLCYYKRLCQMSPNKLARQAFECQMSLHNQRVSTWIGKVKELSRNLNIDIDNVDPGTFKELCKKARTDNFIEKWKANLNDSPSPILRNFTRLLKKRLD